MLESSVSGEKFKFHKLIHASFMDKLVLLWSLMLVSLCIYIKLA